MAKPNPGFNFTFNTPSPAAAQQAQQPATTTGQLQVPSFAFGQTAVKAPVAAAPNVSFGTPGALNLGTAATPTTKPVGAATAAPAAGSAQQPSFNFGIPGATATSAAGASAAPAPAQSSASAPNLGFSFTTPTPAAAATTAAAAGGLPTLTLPTASVAATTATTSATASPFNLTTPVQATSAATTTQAPGIVTAPTLTTAPGGTPGVAVTTSATATTTAGATNKAAMKFGELEQLVASRRAELEQAGRAFMQLAAVLANRDAELRRSAVKLVGAEAELDRLRMTAETLDRELDYADTQTTELEGAVDDIERQLVGLGGQSQQSTTAPTSTAAIMPGSSAATAGGMGASGDRASTLQMAVAIDAQLRASARQLRSLSERVNSITGAAALTGLGGQQGPDSTGSFSATYGTGGAGAGSGTNMTTVTRLLDSQLRLLEWAESTSSQLQRRIDTMSNRYGGNIPGSVLGPSTVTLD